MKCHINPMHCAPKAWFCLFVPTAGVRYPILDVDEPLCDLGLPCFLCVFLILLGRSHLASIVFFALCWGSASAGSGSASPLPGHPETGRGCAACSLLCPLPQPQGSAGAGLEELSAQQRERPGHHQGLTWAGGV